MTTYTDYQQRELDLSSADELDRNTKLMVIRAADFPGYWTLYYVRHNTTFGLYSSHAEAFKVASQLLAMGGRK